MTTGLDIHKTIYFRKAYDLMHFIRWRKKIFLFFLSFYKINKEKLKNTYFTSK